MKYKYKNLKHVTLHGIEPYGEKIFDHKIEGGGIKLLEVIDEKKTRNIERVNTNKKKNKMESD